MSEASTPDYKRVELVWPGKKTQVERVKLPFQVIERVNDVRRSEGGQGHLLGTELPLEWPSNWRNKLIWGDNKYVLASLLDEFAGKVDLIYIDPPFATGADFTFKAEIGESGLDIEKQHSAIEEKAYRDTWGAGLGSFLQMLYERLALIRELLTDTGSLYVHIEPDTGNLIRPILDELFGEDCRRTEIAWKRTSSHGNVSRNFGEIWESISFYTRSSTSWTWNQQHVEFDEKYIESHFGGRDPDGRQWTTSDLVNPGVRPNLRYEYKGFQPHRNGWKISKEKMQELDGQGRLYFPPDPNGRIRLKRYLDEIPGQIAQNLWLDISPINSQAKEALGFATQKPEALLERVIATSSNEGDVVADFFWGSGTTLSVAERLNRRWIGCDLGRFPIQTSRKRLLDMRAKPFEVLNLGRYERRYWQGATAGEAIGEYYRFIIELFHGEVIPGFAHLHGVKAGHLLHTGATDAPVTEPELRGALEECKANGFTDLDVLGWEWEMGLNREGAERLAGEFGIKLRLFNIPREVMDKRAVDAGDIHFFELSVANLQTTVAGAEADVELCGFLPAIDEYMRKKVGDAALKWSDWIDYWSIDFEYDGETFINQWQAYRTRKNRTLTLRSDPHKYETPGEYTLVVKVIDIFGNDTTQQLKAEIG